jgi:GNAT superfamily N-acetyltransferase
MVEQMPEPLTIQSVDHEEVYFSFAAQMRRERVATKRDDPRTRYLGAFSGPLLVGVVGWLQLSATHARLKSDFVRPAYRGRGIYRALWEARLEAVARSGPPRVMTAFCTPLSLPTYLLAGFAVESERAGIAFVKKTL